MAILTSLSTTTPNNLQLDAGIFIANMKIEKFLETGQIPHGDMAYCLGATKGGATLTTTPEIRNLFDGIDGARGAYKLGQVIDTWDITLKTTMSEMTAANLGHAIANVKQTPVKSNVEPIKEVYDKLQPQLNMVEENMYLTNICWLGSLVGSDKPMVIELKNVLNSNGVNITAEDKGTGSIEVEFKAHFNLKTPEIVPITVYMPQPKPTPQKAELTKK